MKGNRIKLTSSWLLLIAGVAIPTLQADKVYAADPVPEINVSQISYDENTNQATLQITSNGTITMPGGNKVVGTTTLNVSKNGVYSFHANVGDFIATDSVHVTDINKDMPRTNKKGIRMNLSYKDELSGITEVRLRNDNKGWSDWQKTKSTTTNGSEVINFELSDDKDYSEGIRYVYSQFKDQAGNITPGEAYSEIIYDITGPTFELNTNKYYVREDAFTLYISDIFDKYSPLEKVSIKIEDREFVDYELTDQFIKDLEDGLSFTLTANERKTPGIKTIQVKAYDDLMNESEVQTIEIHHDNKAPTQGEIDLRTVANNPIDVVEGGRQWDESKSSYVYYEEGDGLRLMKEDHMRIQLQLGDLHDGLPAGVFPDEEREGFARVDVIEYNIRTDRNGNYVNGSQTEVKRKTYREEINEDGTLFIPWELSYGLEKRIGIEVYDNAGNKQVFYDDPFFMSALNLVHFKVKDVVNPYVDWTDVTYSDENTRSANMLAGADVEFETMFNLLTSEKPTKLFGSLEVITKHENGYEHRQTIPLNESEILREKQYPYFGKINGKRLDESGLPVGYFTLPGDAPNGSKVYIDGFIKAEFKDGKPLQVYFPVKQTGFEKEIGVIGAHIQEILKFRSTE